MRRIGLILCCAVSLAASTAHANPWTRDSGSAYIATKYAYIGAKKFFGPNGSLVELGNSYRQHTISLYAEVGILDRWLTATFDGTLYRRSQISGQGFAHGLGDLRLGLWSGLLTAPFRISAGVIVGLPTGDPSPDVSADARPGANLIAASLPTGDGEPDVEFAVAFGHSFGKRGFWPLEHYAIARFGYWLRTSSRLDIPGQTDNSFADAFNWHLELGTRLPWKFIDRFWFVFRVFGSESFASDQEAAAGFAGLGNGVQFRSYGVTIVARLYKQLSLSFAVDSAFSARSIAAAPNLQFGLSYEW